MAVNPKKEDWMPRCEFCSFFEVEKKDDLGFCHRNPPALINLKPPINPANPPIPSVIAFVIVLNELLYLPAFGFLID